MLASLIADPKSAVAAHGAVAVKAEIYACTDVATLTQVQTACQRAGVVLLSIDAQKRIAALTSAPCPACGATVKTAAGRFAVHLRKPGDVEGGACPGGGQPVEGVAPVTESAKEVAVEPVPVVEDPATLAARLGWTLEVLHDIGGRSEQQDRWAVAEVGGALLVIIADGMGGHHGGAEAAETACRVFVEYARDRGAMLATLRGALYATDASLAPHYRGAPGTTLTALLLTSDRALLAHAGDSAALRWDGARWVEATIRHGQGRHLDLCVGSGGLESSEVTPQLEAVATGDVWLLCSDGLIPDVGKDGLWSSGNRRRMMPPDFAPGFLPAALEDARAAGSTDNATGILLYWTPVEAPTPEEEIARDLAAWTNSEPAEPEVPAGFSFDSAEGEPVKMTCTLCGTLVDARRWRIGRSMFALRPHDGAAGPCRRLGRGVPMESEAPSVFEVLPAVMAAEQAADPLTEVVASVEAALPQSEPEPAPTNDLSPRQRALLDRLLDVQSISVEARAGLDEPRWADTGEPVEDDAPLLREAIRLEEAGKARSSYVDDFKRKLALLEAGRRLPKRGREAATVEREPVNSEPLAGEEMPEVGDAERRPWIYTESIAIAEDIVSLPAAPEIVSTDILTLARTIRSEYFTQEGGYTRGEVMTYHRAWELGISEAVALEAFTLPGGESFDAGKPLEPACNFPMDGTEPHAKALVLEMVPEPSASWAKWHRVPRQAFACTENVPPEITAAQARLYLARLTDGEVVRVARECVEKVRGDDDLPHPIAAPESDPDDVAASLLTVSDAAQTGGVLDEILVALGCKVEEAIPKINALNRAASAWGALVDTLRQRHKLDEREVVKWMLCPADDDGVPLTDYRDQILAIEDCLNTLDPDNLARSEDDTTAEQVISILRRMLNGSEDLTAALQLTDAGVRATLVELGGIQPRAVFVADVSRETAQRLGRSPGLYGRVVVMLKGDP